MTKSRLSQLRIKASTSEASALEEVLDELRVLIRDKHGMTAFFCFSTQIKGLNQLRIYGPADSITADIITGSLIRSPTAHTRAILPISFPR